MHPVIPRYSACFSTHAGYALVVLPLVALPASRPSAHPLRSTTIHVPTTEPLNEGFLRVKTRDTCIPYRVDTCNAFTGSTVAGTPWLRFYADVLASSLRAHPARRCNNTDPVGTTIFGSVPLRASFTAGNSRSKLWYVRLKKYIDHLLLKKIASGKR